MRSPIEEIPRGLQWLVIIFIFRMAERGEREGGVGEAELQRMVQTMVEKALEEERARTTSRLQSSSGRPPPPRF